MSARASILVSLHGADADIEGFMRDITQQTVFPDCELVVHDFPASHADAGRVRQAVRGYESEFSKIFYMAPGDDPGLFETWNRQIAQSQSDYIVMACIDDRRAPVYLERHLDELDRDPSIDMVCAVMLATRQPNETWVSNSAFRTYCRGFNWGERSVSSIGSPTDFVGADLFCYDKASQIIDSANLPHCMPVWRRSLHRRNGYFDEPQYGPLADWEFWLRCSSSGLRFRRLNEILGLYFENPSSYNRRIPTRDKMELIIQRYGNASPR